MLALGFSINLLTLLALVLASAWWSTMPSSWWRTSTGIWRTACRRSARPLQAARELGSPIIAMTVVLLAVYIPIGFQGGLTGALFTEFAFTLAGAVTVSAVIALTLSPMMCSRLLHAQKADQTDWESRVIRFIDKRFEWLRDGYQRLLQRSLRYTPVTAVFVVIGHGAAYFYCIAAPRANWRRPRISAFVLAQATYAPDATLQQKLLFGSQAFSLVNSQPGVATVFQIDAPGQSITGVPLVPPDQRKFTATSSSVACRMR